MNRSLYSKNYDVLRQWLREKRAESGLSIRAVAAELECHHSIVGKIEKGGRKLDVVEFIEYCQVIGADPREAMTLLTKLSAG